MPNASRLSSKTTPSSHSAARPVAPRGDQSTRGGRCAGPEPFGSAVRVWTEVVQDGYLPAGGRDAVGVEVGQHDPRAVRRLRHDDTPRIDDQAVTVRRVPRRRHAALRRGDDVRPVLDSARAKERLPMVAPGALCEIGRHAKDLRAGQSKHAVQLRKTEVVADR